MTITSRIFTASATLIFWSVIAGTGFAGSAGNNMEQGFANPPDSANRAYGGTGQGEMLQRRE